MKVTLEYLQTVCNQMAKAKVVPLPVYIAIIGDKKFMCPVSSLPEGLAPLPCEIVSAQFPIEAGGTARDKASVPCVHEWESGMFFSICKKCGLIDDA